MGSGIRAAALAATLVACGAGNTDSSVAADAPIEQSRSSEQDSDRGIGEDMLTPDGWGPLRIGMTRDEIVEAAGDDANPGAVGGPDPDRCDEFRPVAAPAGMLVMVENGVLTRIGVSRNSSIRTPEGARVGDTAASVLGAYASRAQVEPHTYWPDPAKYITVWREAASSGARRGIRYEIDQNDRVVHIYGGGPSIEYVEGCL